MPSGGGVHSIILTPPLQRIITPPLTKRQEPRLSTFQKALELIGALPPKLVKLRGLQEPVVSSHVSRMPIAP